MTVFEITKNMDKVVSALLHHEAR
jgi:hypothetical protein